MHAATRLELSMSLANLPLDSSPFKEYLPIVEEVVYRDFFPVDIFVRKIPNFKSKRSYEKLLAMVDELEGLKWGLPDSTQLFLPAYLDHISFFGGGLVTDSDAIRDFFNPAYLAEFLADSEFGPFVRLNCAAKRREDLIKSFHFTVNYFNVSDWPQRKSLADQLRAICRKYQADLDPIPYAFPLVYLDNAELQVPSMLQTWGMAVLATAGITLAFLSVQISSHMPPSKAWPATFRSAGLVTTSLFSIQIGVVGGLQILGETINTLSVITNIVTVGLAVDFTAHVCLKYETTDQTRSAPERIAETVVWLAPPLVQGGMTTMVAVVTLSLVRCGLMRVFYKSVCLVIGFGLAHGFIVIPLLYSLFHISPIGSQKISISAAFSTQQIHRESLILPAKIEDDSSVKQSHSIIATMRGVQLRVSIKLG